MSALLKKLTDAVSFNRIKEYWGLSTKSWNKTNENV
jgi:ribosomal protein L5